MSVWVNEELLFDLKYKTASVQKVEVKTKCLEWGQAIPEDYRDTAAGKKLRKENSVGIQIGKRPEGWQELLEVKQKQE